MHTRACLRHTAFAVLLWAAPVALAQDLPDASLPDASVGQGGADRDTEENEMGGPCLDSRDCEGGFTCQDGRCVPGGVKKVGCGGAAALGVLTAGVGLTLVRRRRSSR